MPSLSSICAGRKNRKRDFAKIRQKIYHRRTGRATYLQFCSFQRFPLLCSRDFFATVLQGRKLNNSDLCLPFILCTSRALKIASFRLFSFVDSIYCNQLTSTRRGSESAGMSDSVVASTCSDESAEKLQNTAVRKISKEFQIFQFSTMSRLELENRYVLFI